LYRPAETELEYFMSASAWSLPPTELLERVLAENNAIMSPPVFAD
jgi:hypothetical protein